MSYDVEASKRQSDELKKAFAEMFPLVPERALPWAICQIRPFLAVRIEEEVQHATHHWTSEIVKVLCEVSPLKTHAVDMARIVVDRAKLTDRIVSDLRDEFDRRIKALRKAIDEVENPETESGKAMHELQRRGYAAGYREALRAFEALAKRLNECAGRRG